MTALPAVAAALRLWSPGLYFPPWPADRAPLVPWLAPDGREWGARRLTRSPRLPYVAPRLRDLARAAGVFVAPPRTPVSRAIRLLVAIIGAGPLGRAALWAHYR